MERIRLGYRLKLSAVHPVAAYGNPSDITSLRLGEKKGTHKSSTSFKTFDIMLKLPSSALNSISCDLANTPTAAMFCTASSAVFSGTRTS